MGAVYRGEQLRLHRPVAIKIMRRDQGRDIEFEQRFHREALAMASLNHPNIVGVIDYGEAGPDYLYIVMELVDGVDLMDVIRTGSLTQEMALALLPQICDALQFAHDHGIIHRDVKPGNIMLTRDGRVKMADFGLAKLHEVESGFQTRTGTGMGTPAYAAPEQLVAESGIDHRADIYALGVMIYQMITGGLPRGAWKPPSQQVACDPRWDDIVNQALQSDPRDRYQQASEVKTDVSRIGADPGAGRPGPVVETRSGSGRISRMFLVFVTPALLLAVVSFLMLRQGGDPSPGADAPGTFRFAGHRYQFVPGPASWSGAKEKAEAMGGHLATVTSGEENAWISATFGGQLDPEHRSSSIWLGAVAEGKDLPFQWVNGETFSYTAWHDDEPNYASTTGQPVVGPFAISLKRRGDSIHWFDDPVDRANANAGFIVEWDD